MIGEDLESFGKPLNSLAKNAVQISFMDLKSIEKLKFREMSDHNDHDGHGTDKQSRESTKNLTKSDHDDHYEK